MSSESATSDNSADATASLTISRERNYENQDFLDFFAQSGVQKPALESLLDFQKFYSAFFGTELVMTIEDRHCFLTLYINAKKQTANAHTTTSSPSSITNASKPRSTPVNITKQLPTSTPKGDTENFSTTDDGYAEWSEGKTRLRGSIMQYLDTTEKKTQHTPSTAPSSRASRQPRAPSKREDATSSATVPSLEKIKRTIKNYDHNSTRGKHRSCFYTERNVQYLKTKRGNKADTDLMRQVGAGFDWALLLWWVPEGTVLTEDYDPYILDADTNAECNALHDAVMESLYDEEEDI